MDFLLEWSCLLEASFPKTELAQLPFENPCKSFEPGSFVALMFPDTEIKIRVQWFLTVSYVLLKCVFHDVHPSEGAPKTEKTKHGQTITCVLFPL